MSQKFLESYVILYHPINPEKDLKAYGLWKSFWNSGISRVLAMTLILSTNMILSKAQPGKHKQMLLKFLI